MKKLYLIIFFLISSLFIAPFTYAYRCDRHPHHDRHHHYRGGHIFCRVCHLYHYPSHHHFDRIVIEPTIVEHGRTVEHQVVTETNEVVE